jgi:hypothetical protein
MIVNDLARTLLYPCVPRYLFIEHNAMVRQVVESTSYKGWFYFDVSLNGINPSYAKTLIIRESDYVKITSETGRKSL